ncbi:MAG: succinate-semialdehyde dehydrogenase/glutarate-semialdehyde dehydrogenase [Limisphaerales bacterium]|jgi:succinate-semialdehyde dehydrogenase/glutarate-semialdehyde dehydrogenase
MQLKNNLLLRDKAFINGNWIDAESNFEVLNPFNGRIIGTVPNLGIQETNEAIEAASNAFKVWKKETASNRAKILNKWAELVLTNVDDLALLLSTEQGKPIKEALGEIKYGASYITWFAEEARRINGDIIPSPSNDKKMFVLKQPIGVIAAITPWNFPNAMIARKVAPALAAGCTVLLKPAEDTPLSALALAYLASEAGIPAGVFNVLTTNKPAEIGDTLLNSEKVQKLSFTGSTEVGKALMRKCADTVKNVSLELGGNAPFIVFEDADIAQAVKGAITSKYRNSGQTCVCANRFFIHENIATEFTTLLLEEVKKLKSGSGLEEGVQIGPLINSAAINKIESLIEDAVNKGAQILIGGKINSAFGAALFEPTVLSNINDTMAISTTEIFGPVAAITTFSSEEEVIKKANDSRAGLAAYFYGNNYSQIWRVAEELEYGMVAINTGIMSTELAPFGGVKESGIGREGSKYGIEEYLELKYLCMGGLN